MTVGMPRFRFWGHGLGRARRGAPTEPEVTEPGDAGEGAELLGQARETRPTGSRAVGSVIAGFGGAAYVVINVSPLGGLASAALRVLAVGALIWILVRAWRSRRALPNARAGRGGFGPAYWAVVALEVALIFGGRAFIVGVLHEPRDVVPWLSLAVGLHFFAFVRIWHKVMYVWIGLVITASAIVAFILVGYGATPAEVAVFGGLMPGFALLTLRGDARPKRHQVRYASSGRLEPSDGGRPR